MRIISKLNKEVFDDYDSLYLWWDCNATPHERLNCEETIWAVCQDCGEIWDGDLINLPSTFCFACKSNNILRIHEWFPIPYEPMFKRPDYIIVQTFVRKDYIREALSLDQSDAINHNLQYYVRSTLHNHFRNQFNHYGDEILSNIRESIESGEIPVNKRRDRYIHRPICKCAGCQTRIRQTRYWGYCRECFLKGHMLCKENVDVQIIMHEK